MSDSAVPLPYDVAIVGTGPAGAAAAIELGGHGLRVALVEKARLPRYKTCGGGVLWRAVKRLPVDVRSAVERECRHAELVHHAPDLRFVTRREAPIVSMVMRDQFDALLVDHARQRGGITLHAETAVTDLRLEGETITLATNRGELQTRFVVAADGVNSVVARKLGLPALRDVVPALECEATFDPATFEQWATTARFDFGLVPAGYGWVFPKRAHLSIGVGTTRRGAAHLPAAYGEYVRRLGFPPPLSEERHGYMIPCRPRERMFKHPRVLFVGDAAGLADPVTAEGISAGIISGQLAGRALLSTRDAARVQRHYAATLKDELLGDLRVARWLAWLLYQRPRWCAALLSRHGHGMSELMTRVVMGETTYRAAIRRPAHYLRLIGGRRE